MDATARRAALKDRARSILDVTRAAHGVADVHRSAMTVLVNLGVTTDVCLAAAERALDNMEAALAAREIAGGAS